MESKEILLVLLLLEELLRFLLVSFFSFFLLFLFKEGEPRHWNSDWKNSSSSSMIMKKPGKPVENDWMTTEEKPEKLRKPGWENYQRFGRKGWLLKTSENCSAKNQRKNSPFGKKPLDTKKPLGMTKNSRNEQVVQNSLAVSFLSVDHICSQIFLFNFFFFSFIYLMMISL